MNYEEILLFLEYDIHPSSRCLWLGPKKDQPDDSDTGPIMVEKAVKNLHILNQDSEDWITIFMNNGGGFVEHGKAIIDAIQVSKSPIRIVAMGRCQSMGAMILQAADERVVSSGCTVMIHNSDNEKDTSRKLSDQNWKKYFKRLDEEDAVILLEKMKEKDPKMTLKKVKAKLKHDTVLSATEAVDLGLADKILTKPNK